MIQGVACYNRTYNLNVAPAMFEHPGARPKYNGGTSMESIISGVYVITNTANGHRYIGSTANFHNRWMDHKNHLRTDSHYNRYLQRAWKKYGADCFTFFVLECCDTNKLVEREQFYIDTMHPEYNVSKNVVAFTLGLKFPGRKLSEENRRKIGEAHKGIAKSEEHRRKISEAIKGRSLSEEVRRKISNILKGKPKPPRSDEHKRKLSEARKGKYPSDETRRKLREARKGKRPTLGRHLSDEHKQKLSIANKGRATSEEHRRHLSEAAKEDWAKRKAR